MRRDRLRYGALLFCGLLALDGRPAGADDKGKVVLSGSWEKKDAEPKLEFGGPGELTIYPHGANLDFHIKCSYTASKEGLVKVKITGLGGSEKVVEKAKGSVPVGLEFQFRWKADGDAASLEDLEGKDTDVQHVKMKLEGKYVKKS